MDKRLFASLILVALCVGFGSSNKLFFAPQSIESILLWMPLITVTAMGQFLVIVSGGIDVSIGSILGCSGIVVGLVLKSNPGLPVPIALILGLLFGLVLGMLNATIITWGKIAPLIVTIGALTTFRGLAFLLSKGDQIDRTMIPDSLTSLAKSGIPVGPVTVNWLLITAFMIAALFAMGIKKTVAAKNLFAYGSNANAAHLRGISANKTTFWVYAISGAMAGLAGTMYAARFGFVNPGSAGQNLELTVIAAVAIGGAKLTGGAGTVVGVLLGCLILSCINVGLSVLGIDANWQLLAYGVVILVAVLVDGLSRRRQQA